MSRIHDALKKAEKERSYRRMSSDGIEPPATGPVVVASVAETGPGETTTTGSSVAEKVREQFPAATSWKPDTASMLFFDTSREPAGTEEFRSLRSRLYQIRQKTPLQRVMIASALPQEGKSFIAANLAQALALQPDCRTLLIDGDLRNPSLHRKLGTPSRPGLTEFLLGEEEENEIIQRGPLDNLFFISSGRPVSGQTELIANGRLKILLERLESYFEWVIIDSPAAIPVTDAGLMAGSCDGVLVVVRSNSTQSGNVQRALRRLPNDLIIGVVLNESQAETELTLQQYYSAS